MIICLWLWKDKEIWPSSQNTKSNERRWGPVSQLSMLSEVAKMNWVSCFTKEYILFLGQHFLPIQCQIKQKFSNKMKNVSCIFMFLTSPVYEDETV